MILESIDTAITAGSSLGSACAHANVCTRTVGRWRMALGEGDHRAGPHTKPRNALTERERARVLQIADSQEFRDVSPKQIVPRLADRDVYIASESSIYRILRDEEQLAHRERTRPPSPRPVPRHSASGPDELYSWDITYLPAAMRGAFYFLYLFVDIWSRKIVGYTVEARQDDELAAKTFKLACEKNGVDPRGIVMHSDNGDPMKGNTMLRTLEDLGVIPSFSRPGVSDDNAYSEALFRTVKFRPGYPGRFESLEAARLWVDAFVAWYNDQHRHSGIRYVTPAQRHAGDDVRILQKRHALYERARASHPERWTGTTRNWERTETVLLNPIKAAA